MVSVGTILSIAAMAAIGIGAYGVYTNRDAIRGAVTRGVESHVSNPLGNWLDNLFPSITPRVTPPKTKQGADLTGVPTEQEVNEARNTVVVNDPQDRRTWTEDYVPPRDADFLPETNDYVDDEPDAISQPDTRTTVERARASSGSSYADKVIAGDIDVANLRTPYLQFAEVQERAAELRAGGRSQKSALDRAILEINAGGDQRKALFSGFYDIFKSGSQIFSEAPLTPDQVSRYKVKGYSVRPGDGV